MADFDIELKVNKDGDLESVAVYPQREVTIKVDGVVKEVGVQPAYGITNIIKKDQVGVLVRYLLEQESLLKERLASAVDVIERHKHIDEKQLVTALSKIPADKMRTKKLEPLSVLAKAILMKNEGLRNKEVLDENMKRIKYQLDFIKENFKY